MIVFLFIIIRIAYTYRTIPKETGAHTKWKLKLLLIKKKTAI